MPAKDKLQNFLGDGVQGLLGWVGGESEVGGPKRERIELGVHHKLEIELRGATCPSSGKTHYRGEHEWKNVFR